MAIPNPGETRNIPFSNAEFDYSLIKTGKERSLLKEKISFLGDLLMLEDLTNPNYVPTFDVTVGPGRDFFGYGTGWDQQTVSLSCKNPHDFQGVRVTQKSLDTPLLFQVGFNGELFLGLPQDRDLIYRIKM